MTIVAVILAGGRARRMGGQEKALQPFAGRRLVDVAAERLAPQAEALAISFNGPAEALAPLALPVLPDETPDRPGPLGGILTGLAWANRQGVPWLLTAPVDAPFLPDDLAARLLKGAGPETEVVMASSGDRTHPTAALWRPALEAPLRAALARGERRLHGFVLSRRHAVVSWPAAERDPFANINTPEDLARAERLFPY